MKAMLFERYGPPEVLQLREVPKSRPHATEILIKIHATTVRAGGWRMRKADPISARLFNGLFKPQRVTILGMELAGEIEAVGDSVTRFHPGERVFASTGLKFGAYAENTCLPEGAVTAIKPGNLSFVQAAAVPSGAIAALKLLKKGSIENIKNVLIYGASGSVGTYALQLAKNFGSEVTAICGTSNLALAKSLGADRVIDYQKDDFIERTEKYNFIFDAVGRMISGFSPSTFKKKLKSHGSFVSIEMDYKECVKDLVFISKLVEAEKLRVVIDRAYPLDRMVEAHSYVEKKLKKGNVAITVEHNTKNGRDSRE